MRQKKNKTEEQRQQVARIEHSNSGESDKAAQLSKADPTGKIRQATRKEKEFVRLLMENPSMPQYKAYMAVYGTKKQSKASAIVNASKLMKQQGVQSELAKYNDIAEDVLMSTMTDFGRSTDVDERKLAVDVAKFAHDKVHGKATQRVETKSTVLKIDLDLSQHMGSVDEHTEA